MPQANALGRAGQWGLLLDLMKEMKLAGHPPTEVAFNAAIEACAKVSRWSDTGFILYVVELLFSSRLYRMARLDADEF